MKKNVFGLVLFCICATMPAVAYEIGTFVAPKGANGVACQATETRIRCAPGTSIVCGDTTKSGYRISRTTCLGEALNGYEYLYDGDVGPTGAACNSQVTAVRCGPNLTTKCYEGADFSTQSSRAGIKLTKTDCNNSNATDSYVYDGDQGVGITYKDSVENCNSLSAYTSSAQEGDAYFNRDDGKLYIYGSSGFPACGDGATFQGPQGPAGTGVCDNATNSSTTVKQTTSTYERASGAIGVMTVVRSMCDNTSSETTIHEDSCIQVVDTRTSNACTGIYLRCEDQRDTSTVYYVCKTVSGSNINTIGSALNTLSSTVASKVDQDSFNTVSSKVTALETTVGNSTSGLVQQTNNLETAVANKLNKDVSFSTSGGYIKMSATGISTPVNVVAIADIKGANGTNGANGASALELWQAQQTNNTTCQKLFGKNCDALGLTEFMQDISDYGVWARAEYQAKGVSANVSRSVYRATLQPCQGGITLTPNGTDDSGGNKYTMTCTE